MKTLLITGYSGFLGHFVLNEAIKKWNIIGVSQTKKQAPFTTLAINLAQLGNAQIQAKINKLKFDAVMHLAANSNVNFCQDFPNKTKLINVDAAVYMAQIAKQKNVPFVFTSSDMVYNGKTSFSKEHQANPINNYGKQKLQAETEIIKHYPNTVVCRMPLMLGPHPQGKGYYEHLLGQLKQGKAQTLFTDEWRSPLFAATAAKGLLAAFGVPGGVYNLGGNKRLNRYQIAKWILTHAKQPNLTSLLGTGLQNNARFSAPRPADVSLDNSKWHQVIS